MAKKKITEVTEELIRDFLDERKLSLWACTFLEYTLTKRKDM